MKENLKTTHYADGENLINGTGKSDISGDYTTKYWFVYEDNPAYKDTYGLLYAWAAAMNGAAGSDGNPSGVQGVCPAGWHLPGDSEWKKLEMFLGMSQSQADATGYRGTDEGGKLKESDTTHWTSPNTGSTNSSGFTALPGGLRSGSGEFSYMGTYANFWSSAENDYLTAWNRTLLYNDSEAYCLSYSKNYGFSVRCLKVSVRLSTLWWEKSGILLQIQVLRE